ncbi:hypothetical protein M569_04463 [Genlisea aurea]|uniref:RING-type domain-containing protein n=1 Tax=Genlisea aurea TaxID=192259 RepID=S8ECM3_9LAMI|nr:hypothetical protein M569_04463 [Genlisea aurea]
MPVSGVLSCSHVFHAECLDQITPGARKSDPPCPICVKLGNEEEDDGEEEEVEEEEEPAISKPPRSSSFPRFNPFREDGPWTCGGSNAAGDCVEGALHTTTAGPSRNVLVSLSRSRFGKSLLHSRMNGAAFGKGKSRKSSGGSFGSAENNNGGGGAGSSSSKSSIGAYLK